MSPVKTPQAAYSVTSLRLRFEAVNPHETFDVSAPEWVSRYRWDISKNMAIEYLGRTWGYSATIATEHGQVLRFIPTFIDDEMRDELRRLQCLNDS